MTLLVGYRHNKPIEGRNAAAFLNDFRISWKGSGRPVQADAQMKWDIFDNDPVVQMAYMTAGPVDFWKLTRKYINDVFEDISVSNVCNSHSAFHEAVMQSALDYPNRVRYEIKKLGAIGMCMNCGSDQVVFFTIEGKTGNGAKVEMMDPGEIKAIGSGAEAPGLQDRLENAASVAQQAYNDEVDRIGHGLRNEALQTIQDAGGRAFAKLGVSPVMALHVAEGARFCFLSERITGWRLQKGVHYPSAYTLRKSKENDFLLCDEVTGDHQALQSDLDNVEGIKDSGTLDPENRTRTTDVSGHFSADVPCAYQFVQARMEGVRFNEEQLKQLQSMGLTSLVEQARDPDGAWFAKHVIYRRLSRIDFEGPERLQKVTKLTERIEFVDSDDEFNKYSDVEAYFALDEDQRTKLEEEAGPTRLFVDDWLEEYAGNLFEE